MLVKFAELSKTEDKIPSLIDCEYRDFVDGKLTDVNNPMLEINKKLYQSGDPSYTDSYLEEVISYQKDTVVCFEEQLYNPDFYSWQYDSTVSLNDKLSTIRYSGTIGNCSQL